MRTPKNISEIPNYCGTLLSERNNVKNALPANPFHLPLSFESLSCTTTTSPVNPQHFTHHKRLTMQHQQKPPDTTPRSGESVVESPAAAAAIGQQLRARSEKKHIKCRDPTPAPAPAPVPAQTQIQVQFQYRRLCL